MQLPQSATTPKALTFLKSQKLPKFQLEVSQGIHLHFQKVFFEAQTSTFNVQ